MRLPVLVVLVCLVLTGCTGLPFLGARLQAPQPAATEATPPTNSSPTEPTPAPIVLILDGSGSMKEADMAGELTRLAAAQGAAKSFVAGLPEGTPVALVSYGDQTPEEAPVEEGCADVSVKVPLGPRTGSFDAAVDGLTPVGWSPIGAALTRAVELLPQGPASVVVVSDGEDTCTPPEPCETTRQLVAGHPGLVVSTIGVRASSVQLSCIAEVGNGVHVTADNADQLDRRLEALRDPGKAAVQLSPLGASGIAPGQKLSQIRERYADFPTVRTTPGQTVEVIWRECRWVFDDQEVLRSIAVDGASTMDGLRVGDPATAAAVLGNPVATESEGNGEWRSYLADRAAGLAWRIRVEGDHITRIVLCACLPEPPVTLDNAVLDTSGLGPIKIGTPTAELRRRGWAEIEPMCQQWIPTATLQSRGVGFTAYADNTLGEIILTSPHYATRSGARVGMTYGQLKQIYGDDLRIETKQGNGGPFQVALVRAGDREVVFLRDWDARGFTTGTRIETIMAKPYSTGIYGGC